MRTIISGDVSKALIAKSGIVPTAYVTNGLSKPPAGLPVWEIPICPKQPKETSEIARNYTLCQNAEALILEGKNDHLYNLAVSYGLAVYAPAYGPLVEARPEGDDLFGFAKPPEEEDLFGMASPNPEPEVDLFAS